MEKKKKSTRILLITIIVILVMIGGIFLLRSWPAVGSSLANPMRKLIGVHRVAQLETALFNIQDAVEKVKFRLGMAEPETPWKTVEEAQPTPTQEKAIVETPLEAVVEQPEKTQPTEVVAVEVQTDAATPEPVLPPAPTPTPSGWTLENVPPFGDLTGEGIWEPYIRNSKGEVVAVRTFLQPDPERPYTVVAVAAFDLVKTDLNFVLGLEEPAKPGGPHGYGLIPEQDKVPGKLLAAFNGGFIAEHGSYGAMADGVTALAGRAGLATLGIFSDGRVRIGEWKNDLLAEEDYESWRQNALMIIHNGEINPKVETGTYIEWGANLDGAVVTMRSAVGLSEDNQVLYYFAGPALSMPVLAEAMQAAGVHNGMLLDINPTHAHFTAFRIEDGKLVPEPLFEEEMNIWVDRYLHQWTQDFFYLTEK